MRSRPDLMAEARSKVKAHRRDRDLAVARSIWPTGKPAGYWPRLNERVWLLPFNREYDRYANRWADVCVVYPVPPGCVAVFIDGCTTAKWWPVESMVPARTRGIAEGRRLAAARMGRFIDWLWKAGACSGGIEFAKRYPSPEAAVVARSVYRPFCSWIYIVAGRGWYDAWAESDDDAALARRLLRSPEWAALPWQREAP